MDSRPPSKGPGTIRLHNLKEKE
jgi:hypothetical protein